MAAGFPQGLRRCPIVFLSHGSNGAAMNQEWPPRDPGLPRPLCYRRQSSGNPSTERWRRNVPVLMQQL
jgi:hypothetical protein